MKVLIAEDDPRTREGLQQILEAEGYETVLASDGEEALELIEARAPDILCLDVMMPKASGYDVCRRVREKDSGIPILFISAKSEEIDKVLGLELGADDFIVKPFGISEVVARIRAVSRRAFAAKSPGPGAAPESFELGGLRVVPGELRAYRGEEVIDLSLRDIKVLRLLLDRQGQAIPRDTFFDLCWGFDYLPNSRTLDQHISQLRKRIERDPRSPQIIRTVHGVGYRYE